MAAIETYKFIDGPPDAMLRFNLNSHNICDLAVAVWFPERPHDACGYTQLGTTGLSAWPLGDGFRTELTFSIRGYVAHEVVKKLAEALIEVGTAKRKSGCTFTIGQFLDPFRLLLCERFQFGMLMDWYEYPGYELPGPKATEDIQSQRTMPLRIVPLFQVEALWIETQSDRRQAYVDMVNLGLEVADLNRIPVPLRRLAKTNPSVDIPYVTQAINAYTSWIGAPSETIYFRIKAEAESDMAVIIYSPENREAGYTAEAEEAYPSVTTFATAGLSAFPVGDFFHAEIAFEVRGCVLPEARRQIADALVQLGTAPLKTGRSFKMNQILSNFQMPLFEKFKFAMLVDWDSQDDSFFFDFHKEVTLLRVVPLLESEAVYFESQKDRDRAFRDFHIIDALYEDDYTREPVA
jgi:hypothetical protein